MKEFKQLSLSPPQGPGGYIRRGYDRLSRLPRGRRLFDRLLGAAIPYTGALGAHVVSLERGRARVSLTERRAIRNHLGCIHAIALANLGELTGNLALAYGLPDDARFIVESLEIKYLKKARGRVEATCECEPPTTSERRAIPLEVTIRDAEGDTVAQLELSTLVGPVK